MSHYTSVDSVAKKSKATLQRPNRLSHHRVICFVWNEALASKRVLKTLNRVQPGWSIQRLRGLGNIILPQLNYDTENHKLLVAVVANLLKESGPLIGKGRSSTPIGHCTLSLAIFCDGITPRGRPNVNIKATLVDLGGTLFPFVENIPETTVF